MTPVGFNQWSRAQITESNMDSSRRVSHPLRDNHINFSLNWIHITTYQIHVMSNTQNQIENNTFLRQKDIFDRTLNDFNNMFKIVSFDKSTSVIRHWSSFHSIHFPREIRKRRRDSRRERQRDSRETTRIDTREKTEMSRMKPKVLRLSRDEGERERWICGRITNCHVRVS